MHDGKGWKRLQTTHDMLITGGKTYQKKQDLQINYEPDSVHYLQHLRKGAPFPGGLQPQLSGENTFEIQLLWLGTLWES